MLKTSSSPIILLSIIWSSQGTTVVQYRCKGPLNFVYVFIGVKVFEFSPDNSPWNSQAYLTDPSGESLFNSTVDEITICYRLKIYRFLPSIYWIDILEYMAHGAQTCCEVRSSKKKPSQS